jgi:predicted NACHT family NTPase
MLPDDRNPHPQIQQDLKGDRNQAIGQAIDSTIVNFAGDGQVINLTINDRIPPASLPPSHIVVQQLTQQEYRQRQVLLNKVKDAWVKGVLEKSLHARVSIELGLQERPDLVQQPFSDVAEFAAAPGQDLPEGTPATTVFDRMGSGRTLLIVGEPGSGKTIALLKLAQDAIIRRIGFANDRTEPDLRQQIPVVFNLSSWARKPQSIEQWLIQELLEKYQVSRYNER